MPDKNTGAISKNSLRIVDFCEINYFVVSVIVCFSPYKTYFPNLVSIYGLILNYVAISIDIII